MKITFYGTAAGEGWPGVFCHCQLCQDARRLKGKNIRTRSQTLVNEDLLLDLPPDNQLHSIQYGLDLSKIVNHFSHNGGWLHDEMACNAERFGFLAAYDGMSIEF